MIELNIKVKKINDDVFKGIEYKWITFYTCENKSIITPIRYQVRYEFELDEDVDMFFYRDQKFVPGEIFAWDSENNSYELTDEYEVIDYDCSEEEVDKFIDATNQSIKS